MNPAVHGNESDACLRKNSSISKSLIRSNFFKLINLWLLWVFVAAHGLSLVAVSGGLPFVAVHRSLIAVSSLVAARALGAWASVVVVHRLSSCGSRALEHRLSSCGARV